jgi:hypothetical protein
MMAIDALLVACGRFAHTKEEISEALGVTTAVHETRTQSIGGFGLLERETIGSQRHGRPLMLPDEIGLMADDACILLTKGHPPILAQKLDAIPSPVHVAVQQAKPVLKLAAMVAGVLLIGGSLATYWLWPSPPPPSLSLPPLESTTSPTARRMPSVLEHHLMREQPSWALHKLQHGKRMPEWMRVESRYSTHQACETAKDLTIAHWHQAIAERPSLGQVHDGGFITMAGGSLQKTTRYFCAFIGSHDS